MGEFLTVGDLRRAIERLPDTARVVVDTDSEFGPGWLAYEQASDVVAPPFGTDPMTEATVGVLMIESND